MLKFQQIHTRAKYTRAKLFSFRMKQNLPQKIFKPKTSE